MIALSSGAMNEHCKILILMGKTDPDNADRYAQQSQQDAIQHHGGGRCECQQEKDKAKSRQFQAANAACGGCALPVYVVTGCMCVHL